MSAFDPLRTVGSCRIVVFMPTSFLAAFPLVLAAAVSPAPDQTRDALLLLSFLDAVKTGAEEKAQSVLDPDAFIGDYMQKHRSTFRAFADYARACQLRKVTVVTTRAGKRMPIGVEWLCPYPEYERHASFWFKGDRITRIGWGKPLVVKVEPLKTKP